MSNQQSSKNAKLAAAAEAVVEAASMEIDTMTQKKLALNLDALKSSFDSNINKLVLTVKSSNENFDSKMNTLNQQIAGVQNQLAELKGEISALKSLQGNANQRKLLEQALDFTDLESFPYFNNYGVEFNTETLAETVIKCFILGYGHVISKHYRTKQITTKGEDSNEAFRQKFKEQIKRLIRREPRMVRKENGDYFIYYS